MKEVTFLPSLKEDCSAYSLCGERIIYLSTGQVGIRKLGDIVYWKETVSYFPVIVIKYTKVGCLFWLMAPEEGDMAAGGLSRKLEGHILSVYGKKSE